MKNYTTYIFDLDGTITDTASVWLGIFRDCLTHFETPVPDDKTLAGHTHDWKQMLELGLPESKLEAFIALAHQLANERLTQAPLHTGAYETLEELRNQGKRVAIFSTMDRPIFEPCIEYRELDKVAEVLVAGTDVPRRKPHPDGILKALQDLGIRPEDYDAAVYIGDKDTDILAAHNAGIDGILYYPPEHQLMYELDELKAHDPVAIITGWKELLSKS
jgi:HAD superfamily hydrolase (TIGR01509 family)